MPEQARQLGEEVVGECRRLGFALAGVCGAGPSRWGDELREWLGAGKNGSMEYLARNLEARLDPSRLLPGARSVVMVADLYAARGEGGGEPAPEGRPAGRIARYARGRDYHVVIKKRLHALCDGLRARFPGAGFRAFTDTAPVLERELAARAGLGWTGKHTLIIHPKLGSWMLLGGVLTTLELDAPLEQRVEADHCGTCTRCIDACPTDAITPYSVDASRCISYLTIERRGAIAEEFHEKIGGWVFGCDVCQEVCPHNRPRSDAARNEGPGAAAVGVHPDYAERRGSVDLLELLGWKEEDRRREFSGSAMKRATLAMMKRNAIIAAGNAIRRRPDAELESRLRGVSEDLTEPELVRRTAREVLGGLRRGG